MSDIAFPDRYGAWAVVAGASEGVGAAFARAVAERGLNVVLLARRGVLASADDTSPIPGAATADDVAAEAIANLSNGPTWFVGDQLREGARHLGSMSRREAVEAMCQSAEVMGRDQDVDVDVDE